MADKKKPPVGAEGQESACETERVMRDAKHSATPPAKVKPDTAAAIDFLRRFHPSTSWALTAIIPDGKTETVTFDADHAEDAAAWIQKHQGKRNLYFHVNPTRRPLTSKASKADIARLAWLHVDIDPRAREDLTAERERALKALQAFKPRPTVIIDSGGGFQGFWRLQPSDALEVGGDLAKAAELEAYNIQLERVLGADRTHNIDRIMRLPGTVNVPNAKKRAKGRKPAPTKLVTFDDAAVYPIRAFTPAVHVQTAGDPLPGGRPKVRVAGNVPDMGTEELAAWAKEHGKTISERTLALIATGDDPVEPGKYQSRSEALFAACCALARAGVDDEVIYAVITGSNAIAASVHDKPNPEAYALRQIERAKEEAIDPVLRELNDKHAVIGNVNGKCRIVQEAGNRDELMGRTLLTYQTFDDFRNRYRNRRVVMGTDGKGNVIEKPAGAWWIDHPMRRQYERVVFAPGHEVEGAYNLWRGFAVEALPGTRHERFLTHIRDNICCGNAEHYRYLIGWMARAVQKPDSAGEVAVVMKGKRGTGKGVFAKTMGHLFGRHFISVANAKHLVGNFNAHLEDTVLLFGDEAFFAGDKKHESVLKTLVTEDRFIIERKGIDAGPATNYLHLILASNEEWIVPAGVDERRFFVLELSDDHAQDHNYFRALLLDLDAGGYQNLLHFLLTYDLSGFQVRKVPATKALREQQMESLTGFAAYLFELLMSGERPDFVTDHPDGRDIALTGRMTESAVHWLKEHDQRPRVTANRVQTIMSQKLRAPKGKHYGVGKNGLNGYFWNLRELREAWNQSMFEVEWPEELLPPKTAF